ncbi:substrate-binding periplasmic protein [Zooshikella harenae]|uniref:Transporter substrate-binding domain-containing protein n=1 Tax=Zooshikella harenae TaxID=2827238 RepID=A0ABS5ZII2_9GAMM|nr:transporter substrate-binding domain-containing protein [Zooshikella harenae]MBU2713884.1 transporter substrate-binding domain-containing protein [Zooshikella harenae]
MIIPVSAKSCDRLVVAGNAEYPPITWTDSKSQEMTGVAVEILQRAFKGVTVPMTTLPLPWARAQKVVKTGAADILAGPYINEERIEYMDYVFPAFMQDPVAIFIRKSSMFKYQKWSDLVSLRGATLIGNSFGEEFDAYAADHLKIEQSHGLLNVINKLNKKRVDYMIYGLYPTLAALASTDLKDQIIPLKPYVTSEGMYIAISKKSPCRKYYQLLSQKLNEFKAINLTKQLIEKYKKKWEEGVKDN